MHADVTSSSLQCLSDKKSTQFLESNAATEDANNIDWQAFVATALLLYFISAPLGMLLDNYHGLFGVLSYEPKGTPLLISFQQTDGFTSRVLLKSALWVPPLFGAAGAVMSSIVLYFDAVLKTAEKDARPSWPKVMYGISFFSFQYYLSGLLDHLLLPSAVIHAVLAALAAVGFILFDSSKAGLVLGAATALAGPAAEIFLINVLQLYHYTHADVLGICSWIPWVYLLGAPAVGNLARAIYAARAAVS